MCGRSEIHRSEATLGCSRHSSVQARQPASQLLHALKGARSASLRLPPRRAASKQPPTHVCSRTATPLPPSPRSPKHYETVPAIWPKFTEAACKVDAYNSAKAAAATGRKMLAA